MKKCQANLLSFQCHIYGVDSWNKKKNTPSCETFKGPPILEPHWNREGEFLSATYILEVKSSNFWKMEDIQLKHSWNMVENVESLGRTLLYLPSQVSRTTQPSIVKGNCQTWNIYIYILYTYCIYKLSKHRSVIKQKSITSQHQPSDTSKLQISWTFQASIYYCIWNRNPTNQPGPLRTQKQPSFGSGDSRPTSRSSLSLFSQIRVSPATKVLQKVLLVDREVEWFWLLFCLVA